MKAHSCTRFLFQFSAVLSICLLLGSLGAWEYGQISLPLLFIQAGIFSAMTYVSYKLSFYSNRRRLKRHIFDLRMQAADELVHIRHSRAS